MILNFQKLVFCNIYLGFAQLRKLEIFVSLIFVEDYGQIVELKLSFLSKAYES